MVGVVAHGRRVCREREVVFGACRLASRGCLLCAARRGRYSYIDFMRYSWGAVMVNQFSGHDLPFNGIPGSPTVLEHYALKCGPPAASRPCARGA